MVAFPKPDRSKFVPNRTKTADNDALDIGWYEGVLSDGRPYRAECWAQDQVTHLTFFFSTRGLEKAPGDQLLAMLERDSLVKFTGPKVYWGPATKIADDARRRMWSINFVVGDEENTYVIDGGPGLEPYA